MREYLKLFMTRLSYPEQAINTLLEANEKLENTDINAVATSFMNKEYKESSEILNRVSEIAEKINIPYYTASMVFYMRASYTLHDRYRENNISDEIFWTTMNDFKCKLLECMEIHGVWGTASVEWHVNFFHLQRFGLGRLQYEHSSWRGEDYTRCGITVKKGGHVINIHIPSSGPLTYESRMDSYRRAYEFYKNEFSGPIIITCNSWLLYPKHTEFLPHNSNILGFMSDFDIVQSNESDTFSNAWRVFGKYYTNPPEQLPVKTSLQRAYAKHLTEGGKCGSGYGIILFDGEKILR